MKAILEFDLPEEKEDLLYSLNAIDYVIVIDKILNYLRSEIKHKEDVEQSRHETLEDVRTKIIDILDEYDVKIF